MPSLNRKLIFNLLAGPKRAENTAYQVQMRTLNPVIILTPQAAQTRKNSKQRSENLLVKSLSLVLLDPAKVQGSFHNSCVSIFSRKF